MPNNKEDYFLFSHNVLDVCLESLVNSINFDFTSITFIDNASCSDAKPVIKKYKKYFDKYIRYEENKGKVYACLNEARSAYEEFVTIADSDLLFFEGWEKAIFKTFKFFPRAGVVSPLPCPYTTFYVNKSSFGFNGLFGKIKYKSFVDRKDLDLYVQGTGNKNILDRDNSQINWSLKQYGLVKNKHSAIIGAFHVVGTYRSKLFKNENLYPELVFKNSYEEKFIDFLADKKGYFRLSTVENYIYHIGNKPDAISSKILKQMTYSNQSKIVKSDFEIKDKKYNAVLLKLNRILGHFFIKYLYNK